MGQRINSLLRGPSWYLELTIMLMHNNILTLVLTLFLNSIWYHWTKHSCGMVRCTLFPHSCVWFDVDVDIMFRRTGLIIKELEGEVEVQNSPEYRKTLACLLDLDKVKQKLFGKSVFLFVSLLFWSWKSTIHTSICNVNSWLQSASSIHTTEKCSTNGKTKSFTTENVSSSDLMMLHSKFTSLSTVVSFLFFLSFFLSGLKVAFNKNFGSAFRTYNNETYFAYCFHPPPPP